MLRFVLVLLCGSSSIARADEPAASGLRLVDVLRVAAHSSPRLENEAISVAIADARVEEARGKTDLVLGASIDAHQTRTDLIPITGLPLAQIVGEQQLAAAGSIVKPLGAGGTLGVQIGGDYHRIIYGTQLGPRTRSEVLSEAYRPQISIVLTQPLLQGFNGTSAPNVATDRAAADRDVKVFEREAKASETFREVIHAYWELAYSHAQLEIRRASLTLADEQLRLTRARIAGEKIPASEAAVVLQQVGVRKEDVILAEEAVSVRSVELRRLAGLEIGPGEIDLRATDPLVVTPRDQSTSEAIGAAINRNPQLQALRKQQTAASVEVEVNEDGLLPRLDLVASGSSVGNNARATGSLRGAFDGFDLEAKLTFSMPLGNTEADGRLRAARSEARRIKIQQRDLEAQIAATVVQAVARARTARARMEVLSEAASEAKRSITAERLRWESGGATTFDVMLKQEKLAETELRRARAVVDYLEATADLDAITGALLTKYGISLGR